MRVLNNFKTYFFRGLAALLPTILTIWVFVQFYLFVQANISSHINRFIVRIILLITDRYSEEFLNSFWVTGSGQVTGFIIALVAVCILGAILASVVGKTLWRIFERALMRTPFLKKVYPYIKQVTDIFLSRKKLKFRRVVAFEYPRKGAWAVGMVTGEGLDKISDKIKQDFLTVFLPTSPTPFTGYVIIVPKSDVIDLDMTIEEALRFTVSGGIIVPGQSDSQELEEDDSGKKKN